MKRLNKFSSLPPADQTLILNLCDKHPYKTVAETLARPRAEGGLQFTTSPSALCKFYHRHHPEAIASEALAQFATALQVSHQAHGEAGFQALLALVQNRLLAALREGQPIAELDKEFRTLERVQKCFLAHEKFRSQNDRAQDAYLHHVALAAQDEDEPDFIDHTLEKGPGAGFCTVEDFQDEPTQLERDIQFARTLPAPEASPCSTFERSSFRIFAARRAAQRKVDFLRARSINPAFALPELQDPTPESLLQLQRQLERAAARPASTPEISTPHDPKSPAISPISPNFHSPVSKEIVL